MGNSLSLGQARALTTASFVVNFATQVYGMVSSPDMKEVADANHFAYSPQPFFIAGIFSLQSVIQVFWLRDLFKMPPTRPEDSPEVSEVREASLAYAPIYALGNFCIAGWLAFWLKSSFGASQMLVTVNTVAQLWAIYAIPHLRGLPTTSNGSIAYPFANPNPHSGFNANRTLWLLHIVAKTFAGVGVLDFVDNGGVWLKYKNPDAAMRTITGVGFTLLGLSSDPIFGATLIYDLIALYFGQSGSWKSQLGWMAGATTLAVGLRAAGMLSGRGSNRGPAGRGYAKAGDGTGNDTAIGVRSPGGLGPVVGGEGAPSAIGK